MPDVTITVSVASVTQSGMSLPAQQRFGPRPGCAVPALASRIVAPNAGGGPAGRDTGALRRLARGSGHRNPGGRSRLEATARVTQRTNVRRGAARAAPLVLPLLPPATPRPAPRACRAASSSRRRGGPCASPSASMPIARPISCGRCRIGRSSSCFVTCFARRLLRVEVQVAERARRDQRVGAQVLRLVDVVARLLERVLAVDRQDREAAALLLALVVDDASRRPPR